MSEVGRAPVFSASEFVSVFNQSLNMMFPVVGIVSELANFRISKNRWVYFDLKDEEASVKFFGTVQQLPGPLEDGMQIEVLGRPYLHPKFGFSIQITSMRPVGEGTIKKAQDLLLAKLKTEGLFDEARKRSLPYPPEKIALVASSESAGYSDFIKVAKKRWPAIEIRLFDAQVQGQDAPAQLIKALETINQTSEPFEVVVMIRGGGSADDLAAFSAEPVVRAVSASRIPTLVAIGHERDTSLAELAADKRASTPSNAAELLVPDIAQERISIQKMSSELSGIVQVVTKTLSQDILHQRENLIGSFASILNNQQALIQSNQMLLSALDPFAPLQKGYALVRNLKGEHVKTAVAASGFKELNVQFKDNSLTVKTPSG